MELENIEPAIRQGVVTTTSRGIVEEAEARIFSLEANLRAHSKPRVVSLSSTVSRHMTDLKATLGRDNDRARKALSKLVSQVVLRRQEDRLMAEVQGNLKALLDLYWRFRNVGAARGTSSLPNIGGVLDIP